MDEETEETRCSAKATGPGSDGPRLRCRQRAPPLGHFRLTTEWERSLGRVGGDGGGLSRRRRREGMRSRAEGELGQ